MRITRKEDEDNKNMMLRLFYSVPSNEEVTFNLFTLNSSLPPTSSSSSLLLLLKDYSSSLFFVASDENDNILGNIHQSLKQPEENVCRFFALNKDIKEEEGFQWTLDLIQKENE